MRNDSDAILDDLLIRWWNWRAPIQPARGHGRTALGFEGYRTSRQYDDENGALDDEVEAAIMKGVGDEIDRLDSMHRTAVYCQARALTLGVLVFTNPRLPRPGAELDALLMLARTSLVQRLLTAGLM
jgi:hypothetical protein